MKTVLAFVVSVFFLFGLAGEGYAGGNPEGNSKDDCCPCVKKIKKPGKRRAKRATVCRPQIVVRERVITKTKIVKVEVPCPPPEAPLPPYVPTKKRLSTAQFRVESSSPMFGLSTQSLPCSDCPVGMMQPSSLLIPTTYGTAVSP